MNMSPEPIIGQLPTDPFWHSKTLEEIALAQGVKPIENFDVLLGGWPEDELDDNFEKTLSQWRNERH